MHLTRYYFAVKILAHQTEWNDTMALWHCGTMALWCINLKVVNRFGQRDVGLKSLWRPFRPGFFQKSPSLCNRYKSTRLPPCCMSRKKWSLEFGIYILNHSLVQAAQRYYHPHQESLLDNVVVRSLNFSYVLVKIFPRYCHFSPAKEGFTDISQY